MQSHSRDTPLGTIWAAAGTARWERVRGEACATRAEHIAEAEECLTRARAYAKLVSRRDADLHVAIAGLEAHLAVATRRKWHGSKLTVIGGALCGLYFLGLEEAIADGAGAMGLASIATLMLASTAVYLVSSVEPQWRVNAAALRDPQADGCLWLLVKAGLAVAFLPFVAGWKFFANFWPAYRTHASVRSAQDGVARMIRRLVAFLGRSGVALAAVGLVAVAAAGVVPRLSKLVEPAVERGDGGGSGSMPVAEANGAGTATDESPLRQETPSLRQTAAEGGDAEPGDPGGPQAGPPGEIEGGTDAADQAEGERGDASLPPVATVPDPSGRREEDAREDAPPTRTPATAHEPVRVGGSVTAPTKIHDVRPVYPAAARRMRVQGVVILETVIGATGMVEQVKVVRSVELLDGAAVAAVRQWRYTPTLLNGVPVPVIMSVTVNFTLQ